jgi:heptosyltransferase-3
MVRDAVQLGDCASALVVKLRHHGDVLLASPVLSLLKARAPTEVDGWCTTTRVPMLEGHLALRSFICRKEVGRVRSRIT